MSILTKILGLDKVKQKAMSFPGYMIGGSPTYWNWTQHSKAYSENDTVYSVVKKIATKCANVPIFSYKKTKDVQKYKAISNGRQTQNSVRRFFIERTKALDEVDTDSRLAKLLQSPNPSQGSDAFFEGLFSFRIYRGEAFIWLNRGGSIGGEVLEMYIIPPDNMVLVPDPDDLYGVKEWIFDVNGAPIPIPKEDIIHWKSFNPVFDAVTREHLRGFDPMKPLKRRVQQDNDSMDSAVAMFQNGGAKGVLFNEDYVNLSVDQETQMRGVIDRKINNKDLKAAVAALQGKWGYLDIGKDSVDMDLIKSQDMTLSRIANALGADADLFLSGSTFSNKEWAQKNLVLQAVMPLCSSLRDELNRKLVPSFKGQFFCDFDFSLIPELQDDITKMATVWNGMFDRGMLNGNEYRELAGFEKSTEPLHEQYLITGNYSLIEDVTMPEEEPTDEEIKKYNDYS
jgi:HK97 family phage portal protein